MGTVGGGVYKHLHENRLLLQKRLGVNFDIRRIAVRDTQKARSVQVPAELLTTEPDDLLKDPEIKIVIELMGGVDRAFEFIKSALNAGKIVITGNKALLAEHGEEIFRLATEKCAPIFFEAAVAGGIPIIKALREALVGNHILSIRGILNGTCNYILSRMTEEGSEFTDVLKDAQAAGYAESDPTLDINGWDAGHKAIILASLAYGFWVGNQSILVEGIENVTAADIRFADQLGYRIKHLAMISVDDTGLVDIRVHPTLIPESHVLASVNGVYNAVAVTGDIVGETLFYGRGAGQDPTTSAVISDLADAIKIHVEPGEACGFTPHGLYLSCKTQAEVISEYYVRLQVEDYPGVLAKIATVFGNHEIGISSVVQPETHDLEHVPLVFMLHDASHQAMEDALKDVEALSCVKSKPTRFRVDHLRSQE